MPVFRASATYEPAGDLAAANEVLLVFRPSRTTFTSIDEPALFQEAWYQSGLVVWLALEEAVPPRTTVDIALEYTGEVPQLLHADFSTASLRSELEPTIAKTDAVPFHVRFEGLLATRRVEAALRGSTEFERLLECRRKEIHEGDPLQKHKLFFLALDEHTHKANLVSRDDHIPQRLGDVNYLERVLVDRVLARATRCATRPNIRTTRAKALERMSTLLLALICDFYGDPRVGGNAASFDEGFVSFACGRLAEGSKCDFNGRPDSANFFLFAELALLAIEELEPLHAERWQPLVRSFVKCQEIFALVFAPYCRKLGPDRVVPNELRRFRTYQTLPYAIPGDIAAVVEGINKRYRGMTSEELISRHTQNCFEGFPKGREQPIDACEILESAPPNPLTKESIVSSPRSVVELLAAIANGIDTLGAKELSDKFIVLDPDGSIGVRADVPADSAGQLTFGPIALAASCQSPLGWSGHEFRSATFGRQNIVIYRLKHDEDDTLHVPIDGFTTFLVIVPNPQASSAKS